MDTLYLCIALNNMEVLTELDRNKLVSFFATKARNKVLSTTTHKIIVQSDSKYITAIEEVKRIPLGTTNWLDLLTSNTYTLIVGYCKGVVLQDMNFLEVDYLKSLKLVARFNLKCEYVYNEVLRKSDFLNTSYYLNDDGTSLNASVINRILNGEKIKLFKGVKTNTITKSVNRSQNAFERLCFLNGDKFNLFLTLTFANHKNKKRHIHLNKTRAKGEIELLFDYVKQPKDYNTCITALNRFLGNMKRLHDRKGEEFYYIGVPEFSKRGNIHFHLLVSSIPENYIFKNPRWLSYDYVRGFMVNSYGVSTWGYGKSDIQVIQKKENIGGYLIKYLGKDIKLMDYFKTKSKKRYYASRNLTKPKIELVYDADLAQGFEVVSKSERINRYSKDKTTKIYYTRKN